MGLLFFLPLTSGSQRWRPLESDRSKSTTGNVFFKDRQHTFDRDRDRQRSFQRSRSTEMWDEAGGQQFCFYFCFILHQLKFLPREEHTENKDLFLIDCLISKRKKKY